LTRASWRSAPERYVAERGAPGKQLGEILKHHAAVLAVAGDRLAAEADLAAGRRDEAGDDVEQRRLAAAARADDAHEFRGRDVEADRVDGVHAARRRIVEQRNVADFDMGHCGHS
jgi:hypothetical protein